MFNIMKYISKLILILILFCSKITFASSEILTQIDISGNERISNETILMFSNISKNQDIDYEDINLILKRLYETNFFKDVNVELIDGVLEIKVIENPMIYNIKFEGLKSKTLKKFISDNIRLKERSSYIETLIAEDKDRINSILRNQGYLFSQVSMLK